MGDVAANLPVVDRGAAGWAAPLQAYNGTGVWAWQNHQAALADRVAAAMAPFGIDQGLNDGNLAWATQGAPLYAPLDAARRTWGSAVREDGHQWGAYAGLPPALRPDAANVPFAGLRVVRDESVPGFRAASSDPALPPVAPALLRHGLLWSASWLAWDGAPVDTPHQWQMSFCAAAPGAAACAAGAAGNRVSAPPPVQVDITPRRLQQFAVAPGTVPPHLIVVES